MSNNGGGGFYVQREGGSIGLRLTGVASKLRLIHWMERYRRLLEDNGIKTVLNIVYVDDKNW